MMKAAWWSWGSPRTLWPTTASSTAKTAKNKNPVKQTKNRTRTSKATRVMAMAMKINIMTAVAGNC